MVFFYEHNRSIEQIAKLICQLIVVPVYQCLLAVQSIIPERDFPQQEIANYISSVFFSKFSCICSIAFALGNFSRWVICILYEAMAINFRVFNSCRHQQAPPYCRMMPDNVFSDEVHVRRPEFFVFCIWVVNCCEIICKRIKPYIENMLAVIRKLDAPIKALPA